MSYDFSLGPLEVRGGGGRFIGTAGEALADRELVRLDTAGDIVLADASAVGTLPCIGITLAGAAMGNDVLVLQRGWVELGDWAWIIGSRVYVTDVAGVMGATAGTIIQEVGVAYSATQIWFDPRGLDAGENALIYARERPAASQGPRDTLNFIEGANITLTVADNAPNAEIDVTIAAAGGGGAITASATRTITAGNLTCGGWNHAQATNEVCATPLEESESFWWMSIDDVNNITMHIASVDLQNDHTFKVLVF